MTGGEAQVSLRSATPYSSQSAGGTSPSASRSMANFPSHISSSAARSSYSPSFFPTRNRFSLIRSAFLSLFTSCSEIAPQASHIIVVGRSAIGISWRITRSSISAVESPSLLKPQGGGGGGGTKPIFARKS